jgi:lactosylceramide 4-alpha-galactosyltransferase
MNSNTTIIVTFLTPEDYVNLKPSKFIDILRQYHNIEFVYVNITDFSQHTPLEAWIKSDELANSEYVVSHTSDVLRYLLLYKFSGLSLDLGVIVTNPYGKINFQNFAFLREEKVFQY